ncbi:MAG: DEAD/DEAH box helicase [Lentisphaerae bacterium]|nr:DEAD/DEAH box helicase [Lentisphaerota bacterium]
MTFLELGLRDELIQAIAEMGFVEPMPIQEQTIPALLERPTDFVGLAQTGTGKTGAFGLPLLNRIDPARKVPQSVILCPTRELCLQIVQELRQFGKLLKGFRIVAVYGGASISLQINELRRGAQVVVATPGRLLDIIQRGAIDLTQVETAVLDEADEMLDMGFQEDLERIIKSLPEGRKTWMFSATMGREVAGIAKRYLSDPVEVTIGTRNQTASNITHHCYVVHPSHRYASLRRIIDMTPDLFGLIFRRTRRDTQELADMLARDGYQAEPLHGDLSQAQRDHVMGRFRRRQVRLLIATDVAARGIDVDDITHIIHYDLPDDIDVYTHRSGRTARAGKSGLSIVFISPAERYRIGQMERRLRIRFADQQVPDGQAVCQQRMLKMAADLAAMEVDEAAIEKFYPTIDEQLAPLSRDDLLKRLVTAELKRIKGTHISHQNLNAGAAARAAAPVQSRRGRETGPMHTFELNVGRDDGINEGAIVRLVCENGALQSRQIGAIQMNAQSTFFDVAADTADQVREGLREALLDGHAVKVRDAEPGAAARPRPHPVKHFNPHRRTGPGGGYSHGRKPTPPFRGKPFRKTSPRG